MPNHISNHVQFKASADDYEAECEAIEQVEIMMKTDESTFDFNVLIQYPRNWHELDKAWHEAFNKQPRPSLHLLPADGYNHGGYDWCIQHWGTKWNAYDIAYEDDSLYFDTAWSTPLPIWEELSKRFPELEMLVEYADEDIGNNCGILRYKNGVLLEEKGDEELDDPIMFARAIKAEADAANHWKELVKLRTLGESR